MTPFMLPHPRQHTWPLAPLQNKNILKYAQIAGNEPKSMILNIEGRSYTEKTIISQ